MIAATHHRHGALNSWDVAKLAGLALMVIDHLGVFFFPDQDWLRAIGRGAMPVFLFLTGFAPSYKLKKDLLLVALVMTLFSAMLLGEVSRLNILWTILFSRLMLQLAENKHLPVRYPYEWMVALLILVPTATIFQYGTMGMMFALSGYLLRKRQEYQPNVPRNVLIATCLFYITVQAAAFEFTTPITLLMAATVAAVAYGLWRFTLQPVTLPEALQPAEQGLKLAARYTLYIYALHLMLFQAIVPKAF